MECMFKFIPLLFKSKRGHFCYFILVIECMLKFIESINEKPKIGCEFIYIHFFSFYFPYFFYFIFKIGDDILTPPPFYTNNKILIFIIKIKEKCKILK